MLALLLIVMLALPGPGSGPGGNGAATITLDLDLQATNDEVPYPGARMWIRTDNSLVLKVESYSLSDRLMRTAYYPNYVEVAGRFIPSRMLFVDELKEGEKSQVTIRDVSLSALPDSVFTKAYLERVNR